MGEKFSKDHEQSLVGQIKDELREKLGQIQVAEMVGRKPAGKFTKASVDLEDVKMIHDDIVKLEEIGVTLEKLGFNDEDVRALKFIANFWKNRRH